MTTPGLPPPVFPPAPPPGRAATSAGRVRPWWGIGDALMMVPVTGLTLVLGFVAIGILATVEDVDLSAAASDVPLPGSMIVIPTLIQQAGWVVWPFVVSWWKGLGPAQDWGWSFRWVDLGIGLGTAMIGLFAAGATGVVTAALVGLEDQDAADNTAVVTELRDSPWLWGILFAVVIAAPVSEELVFRGLILRTVSRRWGTVVGVVVSLLAFVPVHFADGGIGDGQIVLWASVTALGLVLAVCAVQTGRLGAPIVAHVIINLVGALAALGAWDELGALPLTPG